MEGQLAADADLWFAMGIRTSSERERQHGPRGVAAGKRSCSDCLGAQGHAAVGFDLYEFCTAAGDRLGLERETRCGSEGRWRDFLRSRGRSLGESSVEFSKHGFVDSFRSANSHWEHQS